MNKTFASYGAAALMSLSCSGELATPASNDPSGGGPTSGPSDKPSTGKPSTGTTDKPGAGPNAPASPAAPMVEGKCGATPTVFGPSPLRRLTNAEYDGTMAELLGDQSRPARSFLPDARIDNFTTDEAVQRVSSALAQQYNAAAESIATKAIGAGVAKLVSCTPAADGAEPCARQFIESFGKRAYRRPLTAEEVTALLKVFKAGQDAGDFNSGIKFTLQAMLVAPQFLYKVERADVSRGNARLDAWEVAARLSYFLTGSMPDQTLFQAAEAGKLTTRDEIVAQATRLLGTPRAKEAMLGFMGQWLALDHIEHVEKDTTVYAGYTTAMAELQRTEADMFANEVFWKDEGALSALFTANYSFRNPALQKFYGEAEIKGDFQRVTTDAAKRPGVLGLGGFSALHAKPDASNAITRGQFVREVLLCGVVPPVPPGLNVALPKADPKVPTTARERLADHSKDPVCAGCHKEMDPIGLALENYDGAGRWRDRENGKTIDASGELTGTDVDGAFDGPAGLSAKLANSQTVRSCTVRAVFRFAFGRPPTAQDKCTMEALEARFTAGGAKLKPLFVDIAASDAFATRSVTGGTR